MPDETPNYTPSDPIRISVWIPKKLHVEIKRIADDARRKEDQADNTPPGQRATFSSILNEKLVAGMGHDWQEPDRAAR